jgi:ABC-type multidrug transport system permease subunit
MKRIDMGKFGWYPIFYREMLLFRKKVMKFGYIFSSMFFPLLYLLAFGLGFGQRVKIGDGSYIEFLLPGIAAMTSMTNSFNLVSNFISMGRLYFKSFQVIAMSPTSHLGIMFGVVLSGAIRGMLAALVIILAGVIVFHAFPFSLFSIAGLLLNTLLFSCLGVVVGMLTKDPEDNAIYTNFLIMPMAFFAGTFFPIDNLPLLLRYALMSLPLSHTNILMRSERIDIKTVISASVLIIFIAIAFIKGASLIKNYED